MPEMQEGQSLPLTAWRARVDASIVLVLAVLCIVTLSDTGRFLIRDSALFGTDNEVPTTGVAGMLQAVNAIRAVRDIRLDCETYVYKYLGRDPSIGHYIDQFNTYGLPPKRERLNQQNLTWVEFTYAQLGRILYSRFGRQDVLIIRFKTDSGADDARITECFAILKAAFDLP